MTDLELLDEHDEIVPQGFTVDSLETAEWAMRKKGEAQAEVDRFTAAAEKIKADKCAQIDERLAEILKPHYQTLETMTDFLRPWGTVEVAKANGKKSVKLLSGVVGFRKSPDSLEVEDEEKATAWLKAHGHADCVRMKETVKKDETKKFIKDKGEVPDACELKKGREEFYAEPIVPALESK
jgi:phage host-nuclease inhibitor protein Gam